MWRRLLDIAEPSLKTDAETAEKLLPDWDWLDSPNHNQALLLLTALDDERFASQLFESASIGRLQYRDAASLSVYCKYADMYTDRTDYAGGQDELAAITLKYDTRWQQDVDALETRAKGYKAEKDAAEEAERKRIAAENAAKQEQSRKDQYSGKLPVDGMPVSYLKYTSIGSPTKTEKCASSMTIWMSIGGIKSCIGTTAKGRP